MCVDVCIYIYKHTHTQASKPTERERYFTFSDHCRKLDAVRHKFSATHRHPAMSDPIATANSVPCYYTSTTQNRENSTGILL